MEMPLIISLAWIGALIVSVAFFIFRWKKSMAKEA